MPTQSIIVVHSYHHGNTRKLADAMASKLNTSVVEIIGEDNSVDISIDEYDLIGFGAGIDSGKHYSKMLKYAEGLPPVQNKRAFIFSTSGIYTSNKLIKDHNALRNILVSKGFQIVGEFGCVGFNTNSILKLFGGMNKGRPNNEDLKRAEEFAVSLL